MKKTDNSHFDDKVALRIRHLPDGPVVKVLDAYTGHGTIWAEIARRCPGQTFEVTRIDTRKGLPGTYLVGDNLKFMRSMDLRQFDVIDLDAYGMPVQQVREVLRSRGVKARHVFVTAITVNMAAMPWEMLAASGITRSMRRKAPSLVGSRTKAWQTLLQWLASVGVRSIDVKRCESATTNAYYLHFAI